MPRYIDIEKRMEQWGHLCDSYFPNLPCQRFEDFISDTPTADVVPKSEVENIFAEIEEIFNKRIAFYTDMAKQSKFTEKHYAETMIRNCEIYLQEIAELKKKYTEGENLT